MHMIISTAALLGLVALAASAPLKACMTGLPSIILSKTQADAENK